MTPSVDAQATNTLDWVRSAPRIAIPVYQREYRWREETCQQLLADVRRVGTSSPARSHFVGSILAMGEPTGDVTLVDGQQRITTIMLMLAAIRDLAKQDGNELWREAVAVTRHPDDPNQARLQPHERYETVVNGLMADTPVAIGQSAFEVNYEFFLEQLADDWAIAWAGLQRLEHVTIELGDEADAQQIFESLNSTGAALSDDELIHNYLHIGRPLSEQLEIERDVWLPIEDLTAGATRAFWRDYLVLTASVQPDFSGDFGVYRAFRKTFPHLRDELTPELSAEWVRYANRYSTLLHPSREDDPDVRQQLGLLKAFEGAPRPLLLQVYDDYCAGAINKATFVEVAEQVQSLFVRRALVNLPRDIGTVGTICRELKMTGYPLDGLVRRTPEDRQVELALAHGSLPHAGYVLGRLQKPPADLTDLQVEHIYPQTPRSDWSGDGGATVWGDLTNDQQAEYRTVLNTIGNLTLLESAYNQGAGNRSFHLKKTDYYPRSGVKATSRLQEVESWDYAAIQERTKKLTAEFLTTWRRAPGESMVADDDLVRVVDLPRTPGMADPDIFEYVVFRGEQWGDVHNIKQLLGSVTYALWLADPQRLAATAHGRMLRDERERRTRYLKLPNGQLVYAGWAPQYMLAAMQESLIAFGLEDDVRVKVFEQPDPAVELRGEAAG